MENIIDAESPLAAYLEGRFFLMFPGCRSQRPRNATLAHSGRGASLGITDHENRRRQRRGCALITTVGLSGTEAVFRAQRPTGAQSHKAEFTPAFTIANTSRRSFGEDIQSLLGKNLKGWSEWGKADTA